MVVGGLVSLSYTWAAPVMEVVRNSAELYGFGATVFGTVGPLQGFPLTDPAALADQPAQYASRYLPVALVMVTAIAMLTGSRRYRPGARFEVWTGLAVGVVADIVQRAPFWYDETLDGITDGAKAVWSPDGTALALLVVAAVAFVLAAWLAKASLDAWTESAPDDRGPQPEPLEVWSLE